MSCITYEDEYGSASGPCEHIASTKVAIVNAAVIDLLLAALYDSDVNGGKRQRAPAYETDKEFDWGDRSQAVAIRSFYRGPHHWGC